MRPFNALRQTSSNEKADFWWWPVRSWVKSQSDFGQSACSLIDFVLFNDFGVSWKQKPKFFSTKMDQMIDFSPKHVNSER